MKKLLTILLCWHFSLANSQISETNLSNLNWKFYSDKDSTRYAAKVPGNIHTDLFRNKLIPDPFFGNNEKEIQWVEKENWIYETSFNISKKDLTHQHMELVFDGLDTYARVYLNEKEILISNNMFRSWEIEIKKNLYIGENRLRIYFIPAAEKARELATKTTYTLPGGEYPLIRKSAYHFGWDWAPRFATCGIWKDAKLLIWNENRINNIAVIQNYLSDSVAEIAIEVNLKSKPLSGTSITAYIQDPDGNNIQTAGAENSGKSIKFKIKNPKRWWCAGLGNQYLYNVKVELLFNNKPIDQKNTEFGLRTIELVQETDEAGRSFYFKLNGLPVFAKGANIIPLNFFLPEVKKEDYEKIIDAAVDANMNMLRVWGGGIYENDYFYSICNKKGIMVWQDMMFACSMYPGDKDFLNNVRAEIREQVSRLRNNPSIVLWCGNNEIEEGWNNWGWQKQFGYSKEDSVKIYDNYKAVFNDIIPSVLTGLHEKRPYHPSSPANGWGRKESLLQGDLHYWGVWWGKAPFEKYREKTGRFVSEYGFQSMPDKESLKKFIPENEYYKGSEAIKNHQKHNTGYETIDEYMQREYEIPKRIEYYAYVSQLLQAEGIKTAIESHRNAKPYCMGSLYWQFNDCWPVTSWSSIDFYGNRKALYYAVKRAFKKIIITTEQKSDRLEIRMVSDDIKGHAGILLTELLDFEGKIKHIDSIRISLPENTAALIRTINTEELNKWGIDSSQNLIRLSFIESNNTSVSTMHYFKKPKDLTIKNPMLTSRPMSDPHEILITANNYLAKDIMLIAENITFSDNYFDLLPGESKVIKMKFPKVSKMNTEIEFISLFDSKQDAEK